MTGFFEMLIALVLSHRMEIGGVQVILKSCKVCIIQRSCVQQDAAATYSASAVDNDIELYFLLNQDKVLTHSFFITAKDNIVYIHNKY